ncbi:DDB1- and CUL4-associated factor 4 isoform X2 [Artibeus jamaicensis]|uniref:DDB1- and CUL4-associated factor 4 isoform X2 n=1 Tax=Artibeus jamaicensis TaxID=9417 RepID=UPI00235AAE20|nr:DDB1- and CUL4-associated factor 4 isoform X2 [Artibeus jamaicensis]
MEHKRLRLLEEEDKQKKKITRMGLNAYSLLQKSKLGFLSVPSYCRLAHELRVSCMQRKKVQIHSSDPSALASDRFNLILADTNSDRLFTVNDVKVGGSKYGIISLHGLKTPTLRVHMHENLYFTNRKVNSVCWASLNHLDSHILLCLMGIAETPGCATLLPASLFVSSQPAGDRPGMLCSFRIPGAWSCAWSMNAQVNNCFSTGLSRWVLVTNVVTGHRLSFGTSSDVLTQQFAVMVGWMGNVKFPEWQFCWVECGFLCGSWPSSPFHGGTRAAERINGLLACVCTSERWLVRKVLVKLASDSFLFKGAIRENK